MLDVDDKYSPKIKLYNVAKGTVGLMKVRKPDYASAPMKVGNVIDLLRWEQKPAYQYVDGRRSIKPGIYDLWIREYKILSAPAENIE